MICYSFQYIFEPGIRFDAMHFSDSGNSAFIKNNKYEIGKAIATAIYQYFNCGALPTVKPFN